MKLTESQTLRLQLLLPAQTIAGLNELVEEGHFINQQDAVRFLLKNGIENYDKNAKTTVLKNDIHELNQNEVSE